MAIRAKLRPLLNEERIEQTHAFMQEFNVMREDHTKRLNKRKSMSKRVGQSFTVDSDAVQKRIERGTRNENLPSNRYLKVQKGPSKKNSGNDNGNKMKNLDGKSEVMGWTMISEEQDYANSDFEAIMIENQKQTSSKNLTKLKKGSDKSIVKIVQSTNSLVKGGSKKKQKSPKRDMKGSMTNV